MSLRATLHARLDQAHVRWRRLRADNPTPSCWLHLCSYHRQRDEIFRWWKRPMSHRLFHAIERAPCANAQRLD